MIAFPYVILISLMLPSEQKKAITNEKHAPEILLESVVADRKRKVYGLWAGASMFLTGGGIGLAAGILEPPEVVAPIAAVGLGIMAWAKSLEETGDPLPDSYFYVGDSNIPGAGQGLFAAKTIEEGTFLFSYVGERLSEEEYFSRYPDGQGRYIAELPPPPWSLEEPIYVDAISEDMSGLARWMNSRSDSGCNVVRKKSFLGNRNLFFYASQDISEGAELCFDYGTNYWDAVIDE